MSTADFNSGTRTEYRTEYLQAGHIVRTLYAVDVLHWWLRPTFFKLLVIREVHRILFIEITLYVHDYIHSLSKKTTELDMLNTI